MIKTIAFIAVSVAVIFAACNGGKGYGAAIDEKNSISVDDGIAAFKSKAQKDAVITGLISKVCQTEGCWFNYKTTRS